MGSYGNTIRDNVIHDTNIGKQYPGIFVYGAPAWGEGTKTNTVRVVTVDR